MLREYDEYPEQAETPAQVETSVEEGFLSDYVPLDNSTVLMLGILELLHAEHEQGRAFVSLAAICKRLGVRMSTLQRLMTALSEQALVEVVMQKERLVARLTKGGEEVSLALQAA
jgi:DNA-binding MarR family transcriptional regulator